MRLFLAINLPDEIKKDLLDQLKDIKIEYRDFRWVPVEHFHVTLQFFGDEIPERRIMNQVNHNIFDVSNFHLYSTDVGIFIKSKITVYLNFRREKELEKLVKKIQEGLQIKSSRKFLPHLTLARYRIPSKQQYFAMRKRLANLSLDINFPVTKICLFETILKNGKPFYEKRAEFPLIVEN